MACRRAGRREDCSLLKKRGTREMSEAPTGRSAPLLASADPLVPGRHEAHLALKEQFKRAAAEELHFTR